MKKCPWCGQEFGDEVLVCPTDENRLEPVSGAARPAEVTAPMELKTIPIVERPEEAEPNDVPDGYDYMGMYDPLEASRLLKRFSDAGVRFLIDNYEKQTYGRTARKSNWIKIYVQSDDLQKANAIVMADVKL